MLKRARRVVVFVIGVSVVLFGLIASFLPFLPAVVIIPTGLAILATEFVWARRFLRRAKRRLCGLTGQTDRSQASAGPDADDVP